MYNQNMLYQTINDVLTVYLYYLFYLLSRAFLVIDLMSLMLVTTNKYMYHVLKQEKKCIYYDFMSFQTFWKRELRQIFVTHSVNTYIIIVIKIL